MLAEAEVIIEAVSAGRLQETLTYLGKVILRSKCVLELRDGRRLVTSTTELPFIPGRKETIRYERYSEKAEPGR